MKIAKNENNIYTEFLRKQEDYRRLQEIVAEKVQALIDENHFFIMEVAGRVKAADSLKKKLKKKEGKYTGLLDITDLVGFRIICYFADTVDEIAKVLKETFDIDEENSVDKRNVISETQFGYLSLHYILSLKKGQGYDELSDIRFEIQIRTVLQHAWAEIEHDLGYKTEFGVPRPMRREFSRIAGLLEIADNQFVNLRDSLHDYSRNIKDQIASGECMELLIDQITLNEFVSHNRDFLAFTKSLSQQLGIDLLPSDADASISELNWLGLQTLGDLQQMMEKHQQLIIEMESKKITLYDLDFVTPLNIIRDMCKAELLAEKYSREQILRYMLLGTNNIKAAKRRTDRLLREHI